jgi:hypothetical protein
MFAVYLSVFMHDLVGYSYEVFQERCSLEESYLPVSYLIIKIWDIENFYFSVVLYGCETWSLIQREEHELRVFENRLPRRIFVTKRNK